MSPCTYKRLSIQHLYGHPHGIISELCSNLENLLQEEDMVSLRYKRQMSFIELASRSGLNHTLEKCKEAALASPRIARQTPYNIQYGTTRS
jgi:hypothetical protein